MPCDCGAPCAGSICRECERMERWEDRFDDDIGDDDDPDDFATDGGVEAPVCAIDGCELTVHGLTDGRESVRGVICTACSDYYDRHGHWPDDDVDHCPECRVDAGAVRHDCPDSAADSVIFDPEEGSCPFCGFEGDVATDGGSKYVNETGAGYLGTYRVSESRTVSMGTDGTGLAVEEGDGVVARHHPEGVLLTAGGEAAGFVTYRVYEPPQNSPRCSLGGQVFDALGIGRGESLRAYEHDEGVLLVPQAADPRVERPQEVSTT